MNHLLIIDPQNDFCDIPGAALPIGGADADMKRLTAFVRERGDRIDEITVTLDSHSPVDIAHPAWWQSPDGAAPAPFTAITVQDVEEGRWRVRDPSRHVQSLAYVRALADRGQYTLVVWPEHCLVGSWGHNVHAGLKDALDAWSRKALKPVTVVFKGLNPATEHYSAVRAEVPDASDENTQLNKKLVRSLDAADRIIVAGEALSHCVAATVRHLDEAMRGGGARKITLLTDCTSPVAGFEALGAAFVDELSANGMRTAAAGAGAMSPRLPPIIVSLLDTDLYKFTMLQAFLHQQPAATGEYRFKHRDGGSLSLGQLKDEVEAQIDNLCALRFKPEELTYLRGLRFIKPDLVDYLDLFQFRRHFITVEANTSGGLDIVARGPLMHVMLFEIFVIAIVSEVAFAQRHDTQAALAEGRRRLAAKMDALREFGERPSQRHPYIFFEFGTRRRASRAWQEEVVDTLAAAAPQFFRGTSNVDLARRKGLVPIGTMAHEYLQAHQAFGYRLRDFQKMALENWVREYRGDLGIALTDTVGMDAFLADFDLYFAKLFDGLRHDSGDPEAWALKALAHYEGLRIDTNTKMLVFSDSLDFPKTFRLYDEFANRARVSFGIGTNLTNDLGETPLNIVMKLVRCNDAPVAKLSDAPGKTLSDDETFLAYLKQVFDVKTSGIEA